MLSNDSRRTLAANTRSTHQLLALLKKVNHPDLSLYEKWARDCFLAFRHPCTIDLANKIRERAYVWLDDLEDGDEVVWNALRD